jgi:uncharacterized protein (TIGR02145 family)
MKLLALALGISFSWSAYSQQARIGTNAPHPSAALDVQATNRGFLPPRVALTATNDLITINNPANGLLVYNTAAAGTGNLAVRPGYYFFTGTAWQAINSPGNQPGDLQFWNGQAWMPIHPGSNGTQLTLCQGIPQWGPCAAIVSTLNCAGATQNGSLAAGVAASNVSSSIPYTNGNGGVYAAQSIPSTGVTGLAATTLAGSIATGNGNITYTISGTPASGGNANFLIQLGGQTCTLTRAVATGSEASCGAVSVHNANLNYGSMTDQDGNVYKTIIIGGQTWMAENLKTRHYRNGNTISVVIDPISWRLLTTGATSWYNNDSTTYNCPYGRLYNWYAVADSRNLCPTGWHVPTDAEFRTLSTNLGGVSIAGGRMKTTDTLYWLTPNGGADNSSGWSGLPSGIRSGVDGQFYGGSQSGFYWELSSPFTAWYRYLDSNTSEIIRDNGGKTDGRVVRCIKD